MKLKTTYSKFTSVLACSLTALLASSTAFADTSDSVEHAQDDQYWADLAQDYPPFVAPQIAARTAARNEDITGQWGPVIAWPHIPVSAANLPDGRILSFSASQKTSFPRGNEYSHSSTWDPASNSFIDTPNVEHDMFCGHLTTLEDGRIFVTGGTSHVKTTSTFDFNNNSWSKIDNMNKGRWYSTSLTMGSGSVFNGVGSSSGEFPELWTEGTGWKTLTGASLNKAILSRTGYYENIWWPYLYLDPKGKVFHAGPTPQMHVIETEGLGKVTEVGPEITDWYPKHGTTVMFGEGKLLVAGGATASNNQKSVAKAMVIDINGPAPIVTPVDDMEYARKFQNAVMLPTGEVLMIGGNTSGIKFNDSGTVLAPEIWNPDTQKWRTLASMATPRNYHSIALMMTDGRVLAAGGGLCGGCAANHQDGEVLSPPYLFNNDGSLATRPTITNAPNAVKYGQTFSLESDDDITKFSMIRMSATTHGVNTDQRYLEVPFQKAGTGLYSLTSHDNINVLTPGYWMLFAVNSAGVPSVAKVINVTSSGLPRITQPRDQVNVVSDSITYSVIAFDADSDVLSFTATGLPTGLSIDSRTGLITGTTSQKGSFTPTVIVSDGEASVSASFNWNIFPAGSVPGISYEYYEGEWDLLPDFSTLTPVSKGTTDSINTGLAEREDYYALRFSALIDIPTNGNYTFYTSSDDGSQLFIDGEMVVNNDGLHAVVEKSGSINLTAGEHTLVVTFFEKAGGDSLSIQYSGVGISKQLLPASLLRQNPLYNVAPVVSEPSDQTTGINQAATLSVSATDLNINDTLSYTATGLPTGLSINRNTGVISGTATVSGTFRVGVKVQDNKGASVTTNFNWSVVGDISIAPFTLTPSAIGSVVNYIADVTGGSNLQYQWNFGDGTATTSASSDPSISHAFTKAGMPIVTLIVSGTGSSTVEYQFTQPVYGALTSSKPNVSMSIVYEERNGNDRVWNVNSDNASVSVFDAVTNNKLAEITVEDDPYALAIAPDGRIWVTSKSTSTVSIIAPSMMAVTQLVNLPTASQPHGIVFSPDESYAYVALEATGKVIKLHPTSGAEIQQLDVGSMPRHLSINDSGESLYVSRFISPPIPGEDTANVQTTVAGVKFGGEVVKVNTADMTIAKRIVLEHSERLDSENSSRGIPNYLGPLVISPDGLSGWVPSKQDNIKRGTLRDGQPLTHDSTVRSISSHVNLVTEEEEAVARLDHDNGGVASSAAYGRFGLYLYVALEGSREVAVLNALDKSEITRIEVGHAPQGLTISADGSKLYTHNFLGRSIDVHDLTALTNQSEVEFESLATYQTVANESLSATVLKGKQLFYDAKDTRVAREQYISCASCHNDGIDDGRVWDMTNFGEGLRNTISLEGRGGMQHGLLHWSANFDEVQDFEGQIRELAGGLGLMSDSDFHAGTRSQPLGTKKAGLSEDLDALAAYVASLDSFSKSPYKNTDGSLTAEASSGREIFGTQSCGSCHSGGKFTDSGPDNLHDIGTLKASSGKRLNGNLTGIDTPTLRGVWSTAPYLHDGSALDLASAIDAHNGVTLTAAQRSELVAYLQQIDGDTQNISDGSNVVGDSQLTVDGDLSDWSGTALLGVDPDDTFGDSNLIDFKSAVIAHSTKNLYIAYENHHAIDSVSNTGTELNWGWQVFIDTDQNASTGYQQGAIGADYIIQGKYVQRYTGTGNDWSWSSLDSATLAYQGSSVEIALPRALIGDPSTIRVVFQGANMAYNGTVIDLFPDDASSFFEYQLPGGSDQFNDAPVATDQNVLVSANSTANITLQATDPEGVSMSYQVTALPQNGTVSGDGESLTYQPFPGFTGADTFSFVANDGVNNSNTAVISLSVSNDQSGAVFNELSSALDIDGNNDDWVAVSRFNADPDDVSGARETINWRSMAMAHDTEFVNVLYESYNNIDAVQDSGDYLPWGWQVYLDTDKNSNTGYRVGSIGADYIIEGQAIHRYVGLGFNWNWNNIGAAEMQYAGSTAELRFPRSLIGNPDSARLVIHGNNSSVGGALVDYYPDGQHDSSSSEQFFKYEFSNGAYAGDGRPVAESQSRSTNTNSTLSLMLSGTDALGNSLTYSVQSNPEFGTVSGTAPELLYTPNANYTGRDSLSFTVNNGSQNSLEAVINIDVTAVNTGRAVMNNVPDIAIDGAVGDWSGLTAFNDDPADAPLASDTIDWQSATMAHSNDTLYLLYRNRGLINANTLSGSYIPWGWQTYLDTDSDASTGFVIGDIGADYIIEGTSVRRYSGAGSDWVWQDVVSADVIYNNDLAEIALPLTAIGNPANLKLVFKGNNVAVGGSTADIYPDNAETAGGNRYFNYDLTPALANVAQRQAVAARRTIGLYENTATTLDLTPVSATDQTLEYIVVKAPTNGTLTISDGIATYTPNSGYKGTDSFDYVINDGVYDSSVASVGVTVLQSAGSTSSNNSGSSSSNKSGGGSVDWIFGLAMLLLLLGSSRRHYSRVTI